jgi:hypothetical protein
MNRFICWLLIFVMILPSGFAQTMNYGGTAVSGSSLDFPNGGYVAASNTFPINTVLEVTNPNNGQSVRVRITSRLNESGVFILLSPQASQDLGISDRFPFSVNARTVTLPSVSSTNGDADVPFSRDPDLNPQASLGDPNEFLFTEGDNQTQLDNPFDEIIANLEDLDPQDTTSTNANEDLILSTDNSDVIVQSDPDLDPDFSLDNQDSIQDTTQTDTSVSITQTPSREDRTGINSGLNSLSDPGAIQTEFIPYTIQNQESTDLSNNTQVITSDPVVEDDPGIETNYFVTALQRLNTNAYSQLPNSLAPEQEAALISTDSIFEEAMQPSGPMGILAGIGQITRDSRTDLPEFEIGRPDHIFWPPGFKAPASRITLDSQPPSPQLSQIDPGTTDSVVRTEEDPFYRGGQQGTLEENLQAIAGQLPERQLFLPPRFTGSDSSIQRPNTPAQTRLSYNLPSAEADLVPRDTSIVETVPDQDAVDAGLNRIQARVVRVAELDLPLVNFSTGERPMAESFPRIGVVQGNVVNDGFTLPVVGSEVVKVLANPVVEEDIIDAGIVRIENIQEPLPIYRLLTVTPPGEVRVEEGLAAPEVGSFPASQLAIASPRLKEFAVESPGQRLSAPVDEILVYTMEPADQRPPRLPGTEGGLEDLSDAELASVDPSLLAIPSSEVGEALGRQASLNEPNREVLDAETVLNPFARDSVRAQFEAAGIARLQNQVENQTPGDPVGPESIVKLNSPEEEGPLSDREESRFALSNPVEPDEAEVVYVEVPVEVVKEVIVEVPVEVVREVIVEVPSDGTTTITESNDLVVYLERAESRPPGTSPNDIKPLDSREASSSSNSIRESVPVSLVENKPGLDWARENLPIVTTLDSNQFYLQFGAFNNPRTARQALDNLESNFPFVVLPIGSEPVYRVFVGPLSEDEKGSVLYWFRAKGFRDAFIRQGGPS